MSNDRRAPAEYRWARQVPAVLLIAVVVVIVVLDVIADDYEVSPPVHHTEAREMSSRDYESGRICTVRDDAKLHDYPRDGTERAVATPSCQEACVGIRAASSGIRSGFSNGSASTILPSARR